MAFSRRYVFFLLVPPAVLFAPLSLLFLKQVLQFTNSHLLYAVVVPALVYGAGAVFFALRIAPVARLVEEAVAKDDGVSEAASTCLEKSTLAAAILWVGGGIVLAVVSALLILPTILGFQYFVEGSFILAAPAMAWNYWAGKRMLLTEVSSASSVRYLGRVYSFTAKIAMVFIGFFIISSGAIVHLVSSRVSTTLENLAISSERAQFLAIDAAASKKPALQEVDLRALAKDLPNEYAIHRILPNRTDLSSSDERLEPDEISAIMRTRNGDSSKFIGPHVGSFAELPDHSILFLSVPWTPYRDIPFQIAFYTLVIAFVTTIVFAIAIYFLSRDLTNPVRRLMSVASDMANGDFQSRMNVFSDDEVGLLAQSFFETRDNLQGLIARVGGSGSTITDGVRVITGGTETMVARAREQAMLTQASTGALDGMKVSVQAILSSTENVTDKAQDSASRATELQASAEAVARSMDYLFQSVEKSGSSVTQMDSSAREMSERTNLLANISEEVMSFVTEMDTTVAELRKTAEQTADISRQVQEDAEAGGTAVNATVDGIRDAQDSTNRAAEVLNELQTRIQQIGQIVSVIEEITDRTNLLSLNAAIIAAQAGEHGLGFTVVADEIRQLADRTRGSTKEISGIIKGVQSSARQAVNAMREGVGRVDENVSVAQHASTSLRKILESASQSYSMANRTLHALEEQVSASRHLREVTSRVSDLIVQINRATEEQAYGTRLLSQEADRVKEIAGQVRNSTDQQSFAAAGINEAMEQIATDIRQIRDLVQRQLAETDGIIHASSTMLSIAEQNDAIAQEFTSAVQNLVRSGNAFDSEVKRFKLRKITEH